MMRFFKCKFRLYLWIVFLINCYALKGQTNTFPDEEDLKLMQQNKSVDNIFGKTYNLYIGKGIDALKDKLYYVGMNNNKYKGRDKKDYVSLSIYFWPNPDTKDGLPYVGKDGITNPESKLYDLQNFKTTVYNIKVLAIACHLTGNRDYANRAVTVLRTWFLDKDTGMNPDFDYAQIVPGKNDNKGNVYGVIETYSLNDVIQSVELLHNDNMISSDDYGNIKLWFMQFLNWCLTSDHGKEAFDLKNNIGTAYDVTVARVALFVGRKDVAENIFKQFESKRINNKILSDGRQPEELTRTNSFGYSIANLNYLLDMERLLKQYNYKLIGKKKIQKALNWLDTNYEERNTYTYKQIAGWNHIPSSLADLYWKAGKCGLPKKYRKLYSNYKNK